MTPIARKGPGGRPALILLAASGAVALLSGAEPAGPRPSATWRGFDWSPVWSLAYSPDGRTLAAGTGLLGDNPGRVKLWDVAEGRERAVERAERNVRSVAYSPDGKTLASAATDGSVALRDPETGAIREVLADLSAVNAAAFSPDGKALALAHWDGSLTLIRLDGGDRTLIRGPRGGVWCVAFAPDGKAVASCGEDGIPRVWDAATGAPLAALRGHGGQVEWLAFSPDGKTLATAGWDGTVRLWDPATGAAVATFQGHGEQVLCVAFSPDGKTLASSSGRWGDYDYRPGPGEVKLWDLATRKPRATLGGFPDRVFGLAFAPDGRRVAAGCSDGTIRIWDVPAADPEP